MKSLDRTAAVLPGSYDPLTRGHLDVIRRAAALYRTVYVAVMINPEKHYLFTMEERCRIAEASVRDIPGVQVISDAGMLTDLAARLGCGVIVKGVRGAEDVPYEMGMAEENRRRLPGLETVFLPCDPAYAAVSSSRVRAALANEADGPDEAASLVAPEAWPYVKAGRERLRTPADEDNT